MSPVPIDRLSRSAFGSPTMEARGTGSRPFIPFVNPAKTHAGRVAVPFSVPRPATGGAM